MTKADIVSRITDQCRSLLFLETLAKRLRVFEAQAIGNFTYESSVRFTICDDRFQLGMFHGYIHGTLSLWPGPVDDVFENCKKLARQQFDGFSFQINQ